MTQAAARTLVESSLQTFLEQLDRAGDLVRVSEEVAIHEVAARIAACDKGILFERVRGYDIPVAANLLATRRCWAAALGVDEHEVRQEITRRASRRIPPQIVDASPLHDVVRTGANVDVTELPVYLQHAEDGGPYISAALDISRSLRSGEYNLGVRRLMVRGARETGVDVVAPSDLRAYYREAREEGLPFEVAFVVGGHPLDYLASQLKLGRVDDFEMAGGLRGEPMPVVKCQTLDLLVPADADIVLEGRFVGDWSEIEGPYGEYHGCLGPPHRNPVFQVSAITRREGAVFQSATCGNPNLGHTDTAMLAALKSELMVWAALERSIAQPRDVYCSPAAGGRHHVRMQIVNRDPGDSRNALLSALSCQADLKHAVVVDEDIDIRNDAAVEWALSTRFQAEQDTIILTGLRTLPLEPSLEKRRAGGVVTSKLGLDATRARDKPRELYAASRVLAAGTLPAETVAALPTGQLERFRRLLEVALDRPRSFADLASAMVGVHQRDLLRAIDGLREEGSLHMDDEGRYVLS